MIFSLDRRACALIPLIPVVVLAVGCTATKGSILAPTDSVITLSAPTSLLPVNSTTAVTVTVRLSDGAPVDDGTEVLLSATRGQLTEAKVRTRNGNGAFSFRAGTEAGAARIEASSAGARASLDLAVVSGVPEKVAVSASPTTLPPNGGTADLTATVTDGGGAAVAGAPVTFQASGGTLNPAEPVTTDQSGVARAKLTTTTTATITARVQNIQATDVRITVRAPVGLEIAASPTDLAEGESTTFTITPADPTVSGLMSMDFGDGTGADLGHVKGNITNSHAYKTAGAYNATAVFKPADSPEVRATVGITVDAAPTVLTLTASATDLTQGESTTFTIAPSDQAVTGQMSITFGDGNTSDLGQITGTATIAHTYATPGGFNATARFKPADSGELRATIRITVSPATAPPPGPAPNPPPPSGIPVDDIDLKTVTFLHADVSDWSVTAELTDVTLGAPPVCLDYTAKNRWPAPGGTVGNPWVIAKVNGQWYAATYEWINPGQICKQIGSEIGGYTKKAPLKNWVPQPGELVGFMVSTHARDSFRGPVQERTNVVVVRWPGK